MNEERNLRQRLLGAWTLDSYLEIDAETGVRHAPFGDAPLGLIVYTADGYMSSVQLQARERAPFSGDDLYAARPPNTRRRDARTSRMRDASSSTKRRARYRTKWPSRFSRTGSARSRRASSSSPTTRCISACRRRCS